MKTFVEKICQNIEAGAGVAAYYQSPEMINELLDDVQMPCSYIFLVDSGQINENSGQFRERLNVAVFFVDRTDYDFCSIENERIIQQCKERAFEWLRSLRLNSDVRLVSINNTQRIYDRMDAILTGFAVNVTIEELTGWTGC